MDSVGKVDNPPCGMSHFCLCQVLGFQFAVSTGFDQRETTCNMMCGLFNSCHCSSSTITKRRHPNRRHFGRKGADRHPTFDRRWCPGRFGAALEGSDSLARLAATLRGFSEPSGRLAAALEGGARLCSGSEGPSTLGRSAAALDFSAGG